jgi:microcystin-dependent protein
MTENYIAEIRAFGFNFAPLDWAQCAGQTIAISQNSTLFAIIGTTYGGNGQSTFQLPNLQDLTAVGMGQGLGLQYWTLGEVYGEAQHTLTIGEVPFHQHAMNGAEGAPGDYLAAPTATSYPGRGKSGEAYAATTNTTLNVASVGLSGGSLPHPNIQPVQALNYCIALYGIYPSQS